LWSLVARTAEWQHGLISRQQLRDLGMTEAAIASAIARGRLHRVFREAFAVGHRRIGKRGRLLAAVLACGPGAVVSHGSAAFLLDLWEFEPAEVDVIAPIQAGRKIDGIRRRFVPPPSGPEMELHRDVPTTTSSRTIVDVAGIVRAGSLSRTIEQAAVLGVLDIPEIDRILSGPRRRGSPQLRSILEDWRRYERGTRVRSLLEARLLPLFTRRRLPIPECNEKLTLNGERFEIDFLWREQRLAIEADGRRFHDNPNALIRDSHRNRALAKGGYSVLRLTYEDLRDRSEQTIAEIAHILTSP
jgi:very-short-patch-repair endonuclease